MSRNGQRRKNVRQKVIQRNLERQAERERKKVAVEIRKVQRLETGDNDPHIQGLQSQINQLLEGHNRLNDGHNSLVGAHNTNFDVYSKAMTHLDARLGALVLAVDDLVLGLAKVSSAFVENVTRGEDGRVHWRAYIKHYLDNVKSELERQGDQQTAAQVRDPLLTPEEEAPLTTNDVVFGGDQGEAHVEDGSYGQTRATG